MSEIKDYPPYLDYPKPRRRMTNGDKIRSMTDEELADFISPHVYCEYFDCPAYGACDYAPTALNCFKGIKEWLAREVEE